MKPIDASIDITIEPSEVTLLNHKVAVDAVAIKFNNTEIFDPYLNKVCLSSYRKALETELQEDYDESNREHAIQVSGEL